ncbi:undecaprenyl-phosphate glucose phosphotransferase [Pandoraea sp.]|uniref:undecaprenyl-phosphate glucose phosphotransferase n=1 Tax=Pandoraea sp. TaxID=1883445 RepID=UPI002396027E|nr:undecaprenyl-phosphate glucose phosphotransferase [Pandoraea sp.]MDE2288500.1 undecaprenyl-phosphate glucose phosphotransferase [Burkholderiales bacterium]
MSIWGMTARLTDICLVVLGATLAHMLRFHGAFDLGDFEKSITAVQCALLLVVFANAGVYRSWRGQRLARLAWRVLSAWLLVTLVGVVFLFTLHRAESISRLWLGLATLISACLLVASRILAHLALQRLRRVGINHKAVAIVGPESHSRSIIEHMGTAGEAGFTPLCVFDENAVHGASVAGVAVMTRFDDLARLVRQRRIAEIWLALPLSEEHTIQRFIREFRHDFVDLRFLPDVRSVSLFNHALTDLLGMPAINVAASPIPEFRLWPKLVFDRLFAALVLVPMLPLFCVIAILVKLSSPGPVLFRQKRKGVDGQLFDILKFRTMKIHGDSPGRVTQASRNDPRVTPLGAFLRRTSLDELPQFINVLMGQMSVVGPRPHAVEHDDLYKDLVDGYMYRYRIKPGITGWAQVNGYRGETRTVGKMEARVKFDLFYLQNWSFWFDIKIIVLTMMKGFVGKNAF